MALRQSQQDTFVINPMTKMLIRVNGRTYNSVFKRKADAPSMVDIEESSHLVQQEQHGRAQKRLKRPRDDEPEAKYENDSPVTPLEERDMNDQDTATMVDDGQALQPVYEEFSVGSRSAKRQGSQRSIAPSTRRQSVTHRALGRRRFPSLDSSTFDKLYDTDTDQKYDDFLKEMQQSSQQENLGGVGDAFLQQLANQMDQLSQRQESRRHRREAVAQGQMQTGEGKSDHKTRGRSTSELTEGIPLRDPPTTPFGGDPLYGTGNDKLESLPPMERDEWTRKVKSQHNEIRRRKHRLVTYNKSIAKASGAARDRVARDIEPESQRLGNLCQEQLLHLNLQDPYLTKAIFPIDTKTYFGFILQWWFDSQVSSKDHEKKLRDPSGHFISMQEAKRLLLNGGVLRIYDRTIYPNRLDVDEKSSVKRQYSALQQASRVRKTPEKKPFE